MSIARRPGAGILAALLLTVACTSPNADKGKPLEAKPMAEVVALAQERAEDIADAASSELQNWRTKTSACQGRGGEIAEDGRWSLAGFARMAVDPQQQIPTLRRIRERWRQQGYEITEDRTFADGSGGAISARDLDTGFTVSVTSNAARPPDAVALILGSPCYQPVAGEDPANG